MYETILANRNGVRIVEDIKSNGHYTVVGAQCSCGEDLIVAPMLFHPDHKKGDPVVVCRDHGVHSFRFTQLLPGQQPPPQGEK